MEIENKNLVQENKVKQVNMLFYLNFDIKTAYIIGNSLAEQSYIFITSFIKHDNKNYTITSIFKNSFESSIMIKSVIFSPDSKLLIIWKNSFANSSIESIQKLQKNKKHWNSSQFKNSKNRFLCIL